MIFVFPTLETACLAVQESVSWELYQNWLALFIHQPAI